MRKLLKKEKGGDFRFVLEPKYDRGELAKEILRGLAIGGVLIAALAMPNVAQLLTLFETKDRRRVRNVLSSLRKKKLIEIYEKGSETFFEVTENGRRRAVVYDVEDMVLNTKKRWDGIWRLVIFDIPERFKPVRMALQEKLLNLGFYLYQRSVYVTPHRCRDEIEFLRHFFSVEKYVKYAEVSELDDEIKLINFFELAN